MFRALGFTLLVLSIALLPACETAQKQMGDLGMTTPQLTKDLAKNLGITETQATGGVGALLEQASGKLSATDLNSMKKSVPGVDQYMKASQSMLGGMKLSDVGGVQGAFQKLGLQPEMVAQFKPYVLDYVGKYSPGVKTALAAVL